MRLRSRDSIPGRFATSGGNDFVDDDSGTVMFQDIASTGVTISRPNGSGDVMLTMTATGKTVTLSGEVLRWNASLTVNFAGGTSWN